MLGPAGNRQPLKAGIPELLRIWSWDSARFPGENRELGWGEAALSSHGFGPGAAGV